MLAIAKTPHIDLRIEGDISEGMVYLLKREYGKALKLKPDPDDELVDWFETDLAKRLAAEAKPGDGVWVYRTNRRWTQAQLGAKLGVSAAFVSDMEHGRRAISKVMAKKLAKLFDVSVAHFV
jgi:DNA-binding XRE family transcriptional regulator